MKNQNTRRGNTQKVVNKKGRVLRNLANRRVSLRTYHAGYNNKENALFDNGSCVEDAEQKHLSIRPFNKKAFTLIELLVVVLIIGILAAVALPQYQKAVEKARMVEMISYINTMKKDIDLWLLQNGGFPQELTVLLGKNVNLLDISLSDTLKWDTGGSSAESKNGNISTSSVTCDDSVCAFTLYLKPVELGINVWRGDDDSWDVVCERYSELDNKRCDQFEALYHSN